MGRRRAVAVASAAAVAAAYAVPALDVGRRSPLGWTDAHNVAYGLPVTPEAGVVADVDALAFLGGANDDYLCARNDYGQTALHLAVRQNRLDLVDLYARRRLCLDAANADGDTPLHYAAVFQRTDAVWMLLGAGADPGATNADGATPLDDARENRARTVVAVLEAAQSHPRTPAARRGEL
jgi:ankyrin repeat protein